MSESKTSKQWCCVPHCRSDGRKHGRYGFMKDIKFFAFPGQKRKPKLRKKWLDLIMRPADYQPKLWHRVCSLHFVDGQPTTENPIPTLFLRNNFGKPEIERRVIKRVTHVQETPLALPLTVSSYTGNITSNTELSDNDSDSDMDVSGYFDSVPPVVRSEDVLTTSPIITPTSTLEKGNHDFEHTYSTLSLAEKPEMTTSSSQTDLTMADMRDLDNLQTKFDRKDELLRDLFIDKVTASDKSVQQYTGIPSKAILNGLFGILDGAAPTLKYWTGQATAEDVPYQTDSTKKKTGPNRKLTRFQEFILVLVRLRLSLLTFCLSDIFGISNSRVTQIFTTWINFMHCVFSPLLKWPSSSRIRKHLPPSFKKAFPKTTCIIDCTEFFIEKPKSPTAQSQTYSNYKHRNTYKALVSITPTGAFNFISNLWGGNTSDRYITKECGFLDNIKPFDEIMADRGFVIRDLLLEHRATLNIPPFTKKCKWGKGKRLNNADIIKTKNIARLRIHVERAIERLKTFRIFSGTMSLKMKPVANQMLKVCAFLCNLHKPLVTK